MPSLLVAMLVFAPVLIALAATAVVWRGVRHRALYFVVGLLVCLGIQQMLAPAAVGAMFLRGTFSPEASAAFEQTLVVSAVAQLLLGGSVLWWLFRGLLSSRGDR